MITGYETMEAKIENNKFFVIGNWTDNLENAEFFKTFKEALTAQSKNNLELIEQDRINYSDMYEVFKTTSIM